MIDVSWLSVLAGFIIGTLSTVAERHWHRYRSTRNIDGCTVWLDVPLGDYDHDTRGPNTFGDLYRIRYPDEKQPLRGRGLPIFVPPAVKRYIQEERGR